MTQLSPVVNQSFLYVSNLNLAVASNTTLTVAAGQARDSNNVVDMATTATTTINTAVTGLNGLDTGTLAASTWYYVYMIADSSNYNATGFVASTSATTPTLPFGYDSYRRIGCVRSDGSSHFIVSTQIGNGTTRKYFYNAFIAVLSAGTASTYTAVDLSGAVPPLTNTAVNLMASYTPATAANTAVFRPTGSSATSILTISGVVAAKAQDLQIELLSGIASSKAEIDYQLASGSDALTLNVLGFTDNI